MEKQIRAATLRPKSFNESDNTIEVVWTTGATVRRRDYRNDVTFDEVLLVTPQAVRLDRLNAGAPLLDTHNDRALASVIGSVVPGSARVEGGLGLARVQLSDAAADADIVSKIKSGVIRNISVGYIVHRWTIESNSSGADETRTAVDWEPLEVSAVPVPADAGAQFRSLDSDSPAAARARMIAREQGVIDHTPASVRSRMSERQIEATGGRSAAAEEWRCLWTIPTEPRP